MHGAAVKGPVLLPCTVELMRYTPGMHPGCQMPPAAMAGRRIHSAMMSV